LKQPRVHQCRNRLAILVDDHAVVAVLHLVQHFPQVLAEVDGGGFCNHGSSASMIILIIMIEPPFQVKRLNPGANTQSAAAWTPAAPGSSRRTGPLRWRTARRSARGWGPAPCRTC